MLAGLVAAAAVGVLLAAPARGGDRDVALSGRGELHAAALHLDGGRGVIQGGEATDLWLFGGGGALAAAWGRLNLQADFAGETTLNHRSADDTYRGSYGGGLHAGWRDPERGALGVFGAAGRVAIHDVGGDDPETVAFGVGVEGQAYLDTTTLYLQAGYLDREPVSKGGDPDALANAGFGRAVGRYFPGEDLELEAELSVARGTMDPDDDAVWIVGWGGALEYRPCDLPVSGFAAYTGAYYDQSDDDDTLTEHRIRFGVRVYFGQRSLKAHDRRGASLDLPRYLEWNGQVAGALE